MEVHNIRMKAYARKEERDDLRGILRGFLSEETEVREEEFSPEDEGGVFTHLLYVYTAQVTGQKKVREFLGKLFMGLSEEDRKKLLEEASSRTDDECNFYVRLSKKELASGRMMLCERDAVHVKIKVAVYPAKKENAVKVMEKLIGGFLVCQKNVASAGKNSEDS